jgi:branched-subunit amino acid transport protein
MPDAGIMNLADWIATTSLSHAIGMRLWAIPTIQSVHIMSLAIVLASAVVVDFRILGLMSTDQPLSAMARRYFPGVWIALVFAAISGLLLLIAEPVRSLPTWEFQGKMASLLAVVIITVTFQRTISARAAEWDAAPALPAVARLAAVVSIALWIVIIFGGRWIAYHAG